MSRLLVFATPVQVFIFNEHILGQLSDGCWENVNPHDHWKVWHNALVGWSPENKLHGRAFKAKRVNYDLCEIVPYVGDKIIDDVKAKFPEMSGLTEEGLEDILDDMQRIMKKFIK